MREIKFRSVAICKKYRQGTAKLRGGLVHVHIARPRDRATERPREPRLRATSRRARRPTAPRDRRLKLLSIKQRKTRRLLKSQNICATAVV